VVKSCTQKSNTIEQMGILYSCLPSLSLLLRPSLLMMYLGISVVMVRFASPSALSRY